MKFHYRKSMDTDELACGKRIYYGISSKGLILTYWDGYYGFSCVKPKFRCKTCTKKFQKEYPERNLKEAT